jgi:pSer/pThr/pTyr-binding forkhead associated (FHA) protein
MDGPAWSTLLFALKWVFIGLVYMILSFVVITVRREMSQRVVERSSGPAFSAGRLKVTRPGSDGRLKLGETLNLQAETSLGTGPDNDIVLGGQYVSRYHARLRWNGAAWLVEDLGSRNGTTVNGAPCPPHNPQLVPSGATLTIGDMAFEIFD